MERRSSQRAKVRVRLTLSASEDECDGGVQKSLVHLIYGMTKGSRDEDSNAA